MGLGSSKVTECEEKLNKEWIARTTCDFERAALLSKLQNRLIPESTDFEHLEPPTEPASSSIIRDDYLNMFDSWKKNMNTCGIVQMFSEKYFDKEISSRLNRDSKNFIFLVRNENRFFLIVKSSSIIYIFDPLGLERSKESEVIRNIIQISPWRDIRKDRIMFYTFIFCLYVSHNLCLNPPGKAVLIMNTLAKVDKISYTKRYLRKLTEMIEQK